MIELGFTPVDDDDDFVFEPTLWDIAFQMQLRADPETDRAALEELADALVVWARDEVVERLARAAVAKMWCIEFESMIRDGLALVAELENEWTEPVATARASLEAEGPEAEIVSSVVQHLAMDLANQDHPLFLCACCIEDGMDGVHPRARRGIALIAAGLARREAELSDEEVRHALTEVAAINEFGTAERRARVRARLARFGRLGRRSMPYLAAELTAIAAEPLPERADDDDVWLEACRSVLVDAARPEFN